MYTRKLSESSLDDYVLYTKKTNKRTNKKTPAVVCLSLKVIHIRQLIFKSLECSA